VECGRKYSIHLCKEHSIFVNDLVEEEKDRLSRLYNVLSWLKM